MAKFMVAMPVPPSVREEGQKFTDEVRSRFDEFKASRKKIGITREAAWLQSTPNGDVFVLRLEGRDPVKANEMFAASTDPFDVWFKDRVGALMNADFSEPIPVKPELIYSSSPEGSNAKQAIGVAIPLLPGKTDAHRKLAAEVNGPRKKEFDEFHRRAGVTEDWWIEPTPQGDLVILYIEGDDLAKSMTHLATSSDETEVWFKKTLLETQGIDWGGPPPPLPLELFDFRI